MISLSSLRRLFTFGLLALALPVQALCAQAKVYDYDVASFDFRQLPGVLSGEDPTHLRYSRAPVELVEAAFTEGQGPTVNWLTAPPGATPSDRRLDLAGMPFWVLAEYRDAVAKPACVYDVIDGLWPGEVGEVNPDGAVRLHLLGGAAVRRCGQGRYTLVSMLGYDGSIFDARFGPPPQSPAITPAVQDGLAKDYVARMIRGVGGRDSLQKRLDAAHPNPDPFFRKALEAAGIRVAG